MNSLVVTLSIHEDGFWAQVFEFWPFFLLVAITIVFAILTFGSDLISRGRWKSPPGATPHMDFAIDPTVIARSRFHTSVFLIRLGSSIAAVASVVFLYFAINPVGIGAQRGYTQYSDDATIAGTAVSLVAAFIALSAAVVVRKSPPALLSLILVASFLIALGPFITTTEWLWLWKMGAAMAIPEGLVIFGVVLGFRHYGRTKRAPSNSTPTSPPFSASVP